MAEFRAFYEESEKMTDYLLKAIDSSTLYLKKKKEGFLFLFPMFKNHFGIGNG